ncbi:MAG: PD-(D/E)XK nuclease domain-containing protein, partial [Muribaculaceae bacterium]|nr:PD-(D/E)XK nuclease domain-containing protein [Muribaculaceae bacterium]
EYVTKSVNVNVPITAVDIRFYLLDGEVDNAMKLLQRFLKSIPYQEGTRRSEGHYTAMLYVIFMLIGVKTQTQIRTSDGRMDILIEMPGRNYVMELKIDGSAAEALRQIHDKDYELAVTNANPTTLIGMNFSTETATLVEWIIE